jgi:N4-gp56 family major capsid protein
MADFYSNLSGTAQVSNSIKTAFVTSAIIAYGQDNVTDQFAQFKEDIGAVAISLPRYLRLNAATTPLTEREDAPGQEVVDGKRTFTPLEYGDVVTKTQLASLQTGGTLDLVVPQLLGKAAGLTTDILAINALSASTNTVAVGTGTAGALQATDVMSKTIMEKAYNKLARANVPTIANGMYVMFMHADVISEIQNDTNPGAWTDVAKYSQPDTVFVNEVGMFKGFRIIRDNNVPVDITGAFPKYTSIGIGFNALGKVQSLPLTFVATGPFDRLARFVNLGYKWVGTYGIVEPAAVVKIVTASTFGA